MGWEKREHVKAISELKLVRSSTWVVGETERDYFFAQVATEQDREYLSRREEK